MTLTPLITAAEGFPALERLVASAQKELVLSFRIIDPHTRLRAPELREQGLATWGDLLADAARRGVRLRLILADFDPLFMPDLHRLAWASASGFAEAADGDVQILCARHGQKLGRVWQLIFGSMIREKVGELAQDDPQRLTPVQRKIKDQRPTLYPVTLHQKCAVADGRLCVIGGLDINERRFDDASHDRAPNQTWHDVSMKVSGDFAGTLRAHLADTWNAALEAGAASLAGRAQPMDNSAIPQSTPDLRLVRTVSRPKLGALAFGPTSLITDHIKTLIATIGAARRHIYIETQFLRYQPIAKALADAAANAPELQLVILLPAAEDRVLFEGTRSWDARHGHALQMAALDQLQTAYGERVALVAPGQTAEKNHDGPLLYGAGPIYIHSKVLLIDDEVGLVGSANLNGRSMLWDTEASVLFRDSAVVADLRRRLAGIWLGPDAEGADVTLAATWNRAARANAALSVEAREGFVLPFPMTPGRRFARRLPIVPDNFF
ncbi:phospholipase D family protein [Puniceibacterium sp. IMCC21224]|uniref:phospholipase D family protein n=1 Tax=Puniceibacterium sp. IMCC21224 TaxID=1618204 RepID=UPI00064DBDC8|nr:phospholipase D family protein [Puniceibacterium sp. IMCC21224]KMK66279.1 phosphatidylserine/phosphatidylglycerophosphate/cardiolipin synthase [Puniceibacterium sp. IMCC21224]